MRLFVGGLSYSTNSDGLRSMFSQEGNVVDATVIEDRTTGQSKGFGFVEMSDADGRIAITRFNGKMVDGRALTVNEARQREERTSARRW